MKRILIVGAGGFGREMYHWLLQHSDYKKSWTVSGFLDDNLSALDGFDFPASVLGSISAYTPQSEDMLVCAIGLPKVKRVVCEALKAKGGCFLSFVHPSVVMGGHITLGEGVVLCPGVILTSCIRLSDFVMFNCHASVGHDVEVGAFASISGHCDLTGYCKVGAEVFMGSRASLIPGVRVGDGAVIGAGAVVIRNVAAMTTVFGNPAKVLPS
jgi:sugar O-acyltransferase (sialic acid O-acetyltransferase NeuD family)